MNMAARMREETRFFSNTLGIELLHVGHHASYLSASAKATASVSALRKPDGEITHLTYID